jgi:5-methylcytosine-specific restriction protein A
MAIHPLRPCNHPGCPALVVNGFCEKHKKQEQRRYDRQRGTANLRGYNYDWAKYSKWFISQPENIFCKLQLPGCTNISECTDHIDPPTGPDDPRFWDTSNHQGACLHCNSVKGHKKIKGNGRPFEADGNMQER